MKKVCLVIIDGWGVSPSDSRLMKCMPDYSPCDLHENLVRYDAIANAQTPVMSGFLGRSPGFEIPEGLRIGFPHTVLCAHGSGVGLPDGLMGNSEVGHLNIGAGRVVYQDIVRIGKSIKEKSLEHRPAISKAFSKAKKTKRIHFLGLVSDGGVHSHMDHLFELLRLAKEFGIPRAFVHFVADGRDTSPKSATRYLRDLDEFIQKEKYGELATIVGRYYAMDRDQRWERTTLSMKMYTMGEGENGTTMSFEGLIQKIHKRYEQGETDEFLKPIVVAEDGRFSANDVVVAFNYRSDRMRQIVAGLTDTSLQLDVDLPSGLHVVTMTEYSKKFNVDVVFPPQSMANVLAEWLAKQGISQSHVAETEKYPHVTFFLNGGRELEFENEDRQMVASPRDVATYDQKPEMSSMKVAEMVVEKMTSSKYPFVMCNLAPPDMVGHTGSYEATVKAVEATDRAIETIYDGCARNGYTLFVTSDHGNAEKMMDEEGRPHTAHTTAPVPFIITDHRVGLRPGSLCDVAPTVLEYMGLKIPEEMTGSSLLINNAC